MSLHNPPLDPYEISFDGDDDSGHPWYLSPDKLEFVCSQSPKIREVIQHDIDNGRSKSKLSDETGRCDGRLVRRMLQVLESDEWPFPELENSLSLQNLCKAFKVFGCNKSHIQHAEKVQQLRQNWLREYGLAIRDADQRNEDESRVLAALYLDWDDVLLSAAGDLLFDGPDYAISLEGELNLSESISHIRSRVHQDHLRDIRSLLWDPKSLDSRQQKDLKKKLKDNGVYCLWDRAVPLGAMTLSSAVQHLRVILNGFAAPPSSASNEPYDVGLRDEELDAVFDLVYNWVTRLRPDRSSKRARWAELLSQVDKEWTKIKNDETEKFVNQLKSVWNEPQRGRNRTQMNGSTR